MKNILKFFPLCVILPLRFKGVADGRGFRPLQNASIHGFLPAFALNSKTFTVHTLCGKGLFFKPVFKNIILLKGVDEKKCH